MSYMQIIFFIFGLITGSFLNVCIYRLPRSLSIVTPPSACPVCHTPIKPWQNIPLLSYIFLGGKCGHCGQAISFRYPLVELLNGVLYWAAATSFQVGWHTPIICIVVSALVVITFIDLDFQIIPDSITLPGIVIGVLSASFLFPDPFSAGPLHEIVGIRNSVAGLLIGGGLFILVAELGRRMAGTDALGGGDIKLMAMIGAFMGWKAVLLTTFIGSVSGSLVGIFLILAKGKGGKSKIPFGPFLALGALVTLFYGNIILQWYWGH